MVEVVTVFFFFVVVPNLLVNIISHNTHHSKHVNMCVCGLQDKYTLRRLQKNSRGFRSGVDRN